MISLHSLQPAYRWHVQQKISSFPALWLSSIKNFEPSLGTLRSFFIKSFGTPLRPLRPLRLSFIKYIRTSLRPLCHQRLSFIKYIRTSLRPLRPLRLFFIKSFGTSLRPLRPSMIISGTRQTDRALVRRDRRRAWSPCP